MTKPVPQSDDSEYRNHPKQRGALHLWLGMVADTLNDAGLDMRVVLKQSVPIRWTTSGAKEYLYKPILEALTGKDSTEQQTTTDPDEIVDILAKHLGEKFGVVLPPFPDRHNQGLDR